MENANMCNKNKVNVAIFICKEIIYIHCTYISHTTKIKSTINGERFAGLNFCGFHPMEFFTEKLLWCLTFKTLKQCHYTKLVCVNKYLLKKLLCDSCKPRKTQKFSPVNLSLFTVLLTLFLTYMWLSLRKPSLMAHLLLREKPIWSIQAAVALLCWTLATPDLQYN